MIGGYVTIKVISLMKTDLEKRLDTLLKDYIQTFSVTKDEIFEDPKDFDESLKMFISKKSYILLSTFNFVGGLPAKSNEIGGAGLYWYYPESYRASLFIPDQSATSNVLFNFYLKRKGGFRGLTDKYSYTLSVESSLTYLHLQTYGVRWWCLNCPMGKLPFLTNHSSVGKTINE